MSEGLDPNIDFVEVEFPQYPHQPPLRVRRCANEFQGQRCAKPGTLSEGQKGEGPWYCSAHFPPFRGRTYSALPKTRPKELDALRNVLKPIARVFGGETVE